MSQRQGFTLVELIVVIAIIAILASVSIVGFTRYIDNARFSNDTQVAAQMTTILTNHLILNDEEDLDAYQVRALIETYDEGIDFTPTADDTGYFYLEANNKIIAAKFEDAEDVIATELATHDQIVTLADQELDTGDYDSPEEIFGSGSHLLTTEDTPVAMVVNFVSNMANSGSRIAADYQEALDAIDDYQGNLFVRLFGNALPEELEAKITDFIASFNPSTTLFVNNTNWATSATSGNSILKVVTIPGLSNIPSFNVSLTNVVNVPITFPSTVRTAETDAMPSTMFDSATDIEFRGNPEIKLPLGATAEDVFGDLVIPSSALSNSSIQLSTYHGGFTLTSSTTSVDLSDLRQTLQNEGLIITGYRLEINMNYPRNARVYIYTSDGLYGYATPYIPSTYTFPE